MKILQEIREQDVFPETIQVVSEKYDYRESVRAIIIDLGGKVALLSLKLFNTQKLPGGGIENNEEMHIPAYYIYENINGQH